MNNSNKRLFTLGIQVIEQIEKHGFEAYFVGGCVRDYLLHQPITDIDLATSATPEELQNIFPKLIPVGIEHGTVLVRKNGTSFEITTFRSAEMCLNQTSFDEVMFSRSLQDDLKRRDFTMNAMAMDRYMQIIDHHNGQRDLQIGVIRAVGNADQRMAEDPLRIMRCIRFMSQFGFKVEPCTVAAMKDSAHLLEKVSVERILAECESFFSNDHMQQALHQLLELNAEKHLPIFKDEPRLLQDISHTLQPLSSFSEVIAVMHIRAPNRPVSEWKRQWKCSNQVKRNAKILVQAYTYVIEEGTINDFILYQLDTLIDPFYRVYTTLHHDPYLTKEGLHAQYHSLPIRNRKDLAINGNDLMTLFPSKRPGKWIEELLQRIEYNVIMERLSNEKICLKEWIMCNPPEIN